MLKPVEPRLKTDTRVVGEGEYAPVPVALVKHPDFGCRAGAPHNAVVMAFRPTGEQRQALINGEDIYVSLLTFGGPQQPIYVSVGPQPMAEVYGVEVRTARDERLADVDKRRKAHGREVVLDELPPDLRAALELNHEEDQRRIKTGRVVEALRLDGVVHALVGPAAVAECGASAQGATRASQLGLVDNAEDFTRLAHSAGRRVATCTVCLKKLLDYEAQGES